MMGIDLGIKMSCLIWWYLRCLKVDFLRCNYFNDGTKSPHFIIAVLYETKEGNHHFDRVDIIIIGERNCRTHHFISVILSSQFSCERPCNFPRFVISIAWFYNCWFVAIVQTPDKQFSPSAAGRRPSFCDFGGNHIIIAVIKSSKFVRHVQICCGLNGCKKLSSYEAKVSEVVWVIKHTC